MKTGFLQVSDPQLTPNSPLSSPCSGLGVREYSQGGLRLFWVGNQIFKSQPAVLRDCFKGQETQIWGWLSALWVLIPDLHFISMGTQGILTALGAITQFWGFVLSAHPFSQTCRLTGKWERARLCLAPQHSPKSPLGCTHRLGWVMETLNIP